MKRVRKYAAKARQVLACLLISSSVFPTAHAQFVPGQILTAQQLNTALASVTANALPIAGGTLTGPLAGPAATFNTATISGGSISGAALDMGSVLKSNGAQAQRIGPATMYNPSMFAGPFAGSSYPMANPWAMAYGPYAGFSLSQPQAEVTCFGSLSCLRIVDGNYNAAFGLHTLAADPHADNATAIGNDTSRNEIGGGAFFAGGANAGRNGSTDMSVMIGAGALRGNASSITFAGVPASGQTVTVNFTCTASGACQNSPKSWTYAVQSGDTLYSVAQNVAALINANTVNETPVNGNILVSLQARMPQITNDPIVSLDFPGTATSGWQATVSVVMSAGSTMTATVGAGVSASSVVAIGTFAVDGAALQSLSNSTFIGMGVSPRLISATETNCVGHWSCFSLSNANDTAAFGEQAMYSNSGGNFNAAFGAYAGYGITGASNAVFGSYAGYGISTGTYNFVGGDYSGDTTSRNCITTGSSNVQLGRLACVPSPTANGQLSIQNAIYGYANNGSGSTPSTGFIGIYQPSPIAMLDVKGAGTSASTHVFRINDGNNKTLLDVRANGAQMSGAWGVADATAQSANIASTTLFTAPNTGNYCMSSYADVTTAATTSSTLPVVTLSWNSGDSNAVQTYTIAANSGNTTGTYSSGQVCAYLAVGTQVTYSTSGYASSGTTAMQYAVHIRGYFGSN